MATRRGFLFCLFFLFLFVWNLKSKYMFISGPFHVLGMRKTSKYIYCVAIKNLARQGRKASRCGSKQQERSPIEITRLFLVRVTYICVWLFAHILFLVNRTFNSTPTERLQQHRLLFTMNRTYRTFFVKVAPGTTFRFWSKHHFVVSRKCAN